MGVDLAIDITAEQHKIILTLLNRHLPGTAVWAYGSRTKWTSRPQSDLDLVVFSTPEQHVQVGALRDALEESNLPFRVDLFAWDDVSESFHEKIKAEHVELVPKPMVKVHTDWRETTLGDVTQFLSGGTPAKDQPAYWNGSISWVSAKDMKRFRLHDTEDHVTADGLANGTRQVPAGTVLLLTRGMRLLDELPVCVTQAPMAFNQDVKALRPRPGIDPIFLPYLVLGNKNRLLSLVDLAGHGTGRLNSDELKALDILLPPASEQRAIARILGTLDDKIELNRRMNNTLEAMARALFKSWFVDFEPVCAKMEGRDPGLPKPLADIFPDRLVDSEIGEIPEGWEIRSLGGIAETTRGRSYRSKELTDSNVALVTLKSFARGGGYKPEGLKSFSGKYKPNQIVRPGEIVVACTDVTQNAEVIGRPAMVQESTNFDVLVASLDTLIVRPKDSGVTRAFLYFLMKEEHFVAHTYAHCTGTTVLHLTKDAVPSFRCAIPPSGLMRSFHDFADRHLCRVDVIRGESEFLVPLRDALLPRLISGDIRLREAEKVVEAVA